MRRVAIYVDGANLYFCQRDVLGWWIDWRLFMDFYRRRFQVVGATYYRALRGQAADEDEAAFGKVMTSAGFALCEKPLKRVLHKYTGEITHKGNLDVELALAAYDAADNYDACLLVSGDSDYEDLVKRLHKKGREVIVVSTPGSLSIELSAAVGGVFDDLRRMRSKIEWLPGNAAPARSARGLYGRRRTQKPTEQSPPRSLAVRSEKSLDSPYRVGDTFACSVRRVTAAGVVVMDEAGLPAFLAASRLHLPNLPADLATVVQVGDAFEVGVIELRPGNSKAVVMVELVDAAVRDQLGRSLQTPR